MTINFILLLLSIVAVSYFDQSKRYLIKLFLD